MAGSCADLEMFGRPPPGVGLLVAYSRSPHVASRDQRFLNWPPATPSISTSRHRELHARVTGSVPAPGEGTVKRACCRKASRFRSLAVAAEEFGVALCLALVALFAFIVIRALIRAMRNEDPFTRFAAAGLAILFATQSAINMAVNLHLIPAKGVTLPFVSVRRFVDAVAGLRAWGCCWR